jgi:hypothetical protein
LAKIFFTVMRYGVADLKRSEDEFVAERRQRQEKQLKRRAKDEVRGGENRIGLGGARTVE